MTAPLRPQTKFDPMAFLTQLGLVLLLALVATRCTIGELASDAFGLGGSADVGGGPGPTTTILLNFACVLPALLVLIRRAIDPTYVLRWQLSHVLAIAVAAWITASAAWASNKPNALLYASTWWAGVAILWAAGQLVRSWTRLRPVLGVAAGLALVFVTQSVVYRFYELPELRHYWETDSDIQARRQADPNDFALRQMDLAIKGGAQNGFFRSPNTFAAAAVLAALVGAGFVGTRLLSTREPSDRPKEKKEADAFALAAACVLGLPLLGVPTILIWSGSKTAIALAALAVIGLAAAWMLRQMLAKRPTFFFILGIAATVAGVVAVVVIGTTTGGLIQDSLNFRWNYWVASARLFVQHPLLGVGWTNFGTHYLGVRLPVAAEEVKDPHNVFVRFATETGGIGLLIAIAFFAMLLREVTRPASPKTPATPPAPQPWMQTALAIAGLFWLLRMLILWPLTSLLPEAGKTLLFALLMLVAMLLTVVRTGKEPTADDRPAPFLVYAAVIGLLVFLLHNQVDFALSETGPLLLFMLTAGGLLGVRHPGVAGKTSHTAAAIGGLASVFIALLAAAGLWAAPTIVAETKANAAETEAAAGMVAGKSGRGDVFAAKMKAAVDLYREASANAPVADPDYPRRAIRFMGQADAKDVEAMYTLAIAADPADPQSYLDRGRFGLRIHDDAAKVLGDFAEFVKRNPNYAPGRIEFAEALAAYGQEDRSLEQLKAAVEVNDKLNPDEPRRLPPAQIEMIKQRLKMK
ncbi:MAG: O-antigen ligase family protein [Tepidisphaeraceae bacterium]